MKCLRCGKIVDENTKVCPECGFELEQLKKYKKVIVEVDDDKADRKTKIILFDNPLLTFVTGIISLMLGLTMFVTGLPIAFIYVILFVITFSASFYFSTKPCSVKMKPVRSMGIVMAFIGLAFTLYALVLALLAFVNL